MSTSAAKALENYKLSFGDSIHVISIVDVGTSTGVDLYGSFVHSLENAEHAAADAAEEIVKDAASMLRKFEGLTITAEVMYGPPESRILEAVRDRQADLVIVGSHGKNLLERLLLGSVSDSVVHHCDCPVLVIRSSGPDK